MSFCFWAWPCILLFRYTGVNGAALLPQGRFKLLLVRNGSLPYMLFIWGVQRKARRGKLPRTVWGSVYPQPQDDAGAPRHAPGRAQRVTATPHASPQGKASTGSRSLTPALWEGGYETAAPGRIMPPVHALGGTQGRIQSWPIEVSCLKDSRSSLSRVGAIWLC